jgi:hypothetical protein
MSSNLLQPFNIITELSLKVLGEYLRVFTSLEILLPVEEPKGNFELTGVLDDSNELFDFIGSEFTGAFVYVNFGFFADEISETATDTLDFGHTEDDVSLSLNVSVENTENVLELGSLH